MAKATINKNDKEFQKKLKQIVDQARKGLEKVGKEAGVLAKKGEKEVVKLSNITKLQFDIMSFKMQLNRKLTAIGERTLELHRKGKCEDKNTVDLCKEYEKIAEKITQKNALISKAKKSTDTKKPRSKKS